jgi:uridine phosphorylase
MFIAVGIAGSLDEEISAGDMILPSSAIRDEGTSHHYLPSYLPAKPSENLHEKFITAMQSRSLRYVSGKVWTTDAPFRETGEEILEYRRQGVLAVEMECAALFSVCSALGLESACGLVASDSLARGVWQPAEDSAAVDRSLRLLSQVALEVVR